jgi:hypothetical protein
VGDTQYQSATTNCAGALTIDELNYFDDQGKLDRPEALGCNVDYFGVAADHHFDREKNAEMKREGGSSVLEQNVRFFILRLRTHRWAAACFRRCKHLAAALTVQRVPRDLRRRRQRISQMGRDGREELACRRAVRPASTISYAHGLSCCLQSLSAVYVVTLMLIRYATPSPVNASSVEAAVHPRYKHCRGKCGRKVGLAQGDGMGGAGAVLCDDDYYVSCQHSVPLQCLLLTQSSPDPHPIIT